MMFENFLRRFKTKKNLPRCSTFSCLGLAAKILFYLLNVVCSRLCGQQRVVRYTKYSMEVYAQQWNPPTLADYVANSLQSPSNGYSGQKKYTFFLFICDGKMSSSMPCSQAQKLFSYDQASPLDLRCHQWCNGVHPSLVWNSH